MEEVLRFDSSVIHWRRRTTTDAVVDGSIPRDADVLVRIGAANGRQSSPSPTDSTSGANASEHLSFGNGPHLSRGATRAPGRSAVLEELSAALPSLRLESGQEYHRADHRVRGQRLYE